MIWIAHESQSGFEQQKPKACEIKMSRDDYGCDWTHMMMSCNKLKTYEFGKLCAIQGLGQIN